MFCHKCGAELLDDADFCHKCGVKIVKVDGEANTEPYQEENKSRSERYRESREIHEAKKKCVYCLRLISSTAKVCPFCNERQENEEDSNSNRKMFFFGILLIALTGIAEMLFGLLSYKRFFAIFGAGVFVFSGLVFLIFIYVGRKHRDRLSTTECIVGTVITIILIGLACLIFFKPGVFITGFNVRYSHLDQYGEKTIGEAFDNYFDNEKWGEYEKDGYSFVSFNGNCLYMGKTADVQIVFKITGENFIIDKFDINGVTQSELVLKALLSKVYEDTDNTELRTNADTQAGSIAEEIIASFSDFKKSCEVLDYKTVARNPDDYIGKNFSFDVYISNVKTNGEGVKYYSACYFDTVAANSAMKNYNSTSFKDVLLLAKDSNQYIYLFDEMNKNDANYIKILEGDIVRVYGTFKGLATYRNYITGAESEQMTLYIRYADIITE